MTAKLTNRVKIYNLANDMRGLVTAEMAAEAGVPAVELRKLLQRGALERVARNIYRIPFAPVDRFSAALGNVLAVGKHAYVSGPSVIQLLDLGLFNSRKLNVIATVKPRHKIPAGIDVTVIPASQASEIVLYYDVPCESVFNAIDSLIGEAIPERLYDTIDEALSQGFLTKPEAKALRRSIAARAGQPVE